MTTDNRLRTWGELGRYTQPFVVPKIVEHHWTILGNWFLQPWFSMRDFPSPCLIGVNYIQLITDSFHSFVLRHSKMVFGWPMPVPINLFNTDGSVKQWLRAFELPLFLDYIVFLFPPKTWFPPKSHKFVITFPINSPVCWAMFPRLCAYMKAVTKFFKLPKDKSNWVRWKLGNYH